MGNQPMTEPEWKAQTPFILCCTRDEAKVGDTGGLTLPPSFMFLLTRTVVGPDPGHHKPEGAPVTQNTLL